MLTLVEFKTRGLWRFKIVGSWDRAVFLDFLDFAGAFWLYLTSSVVKYWIGYWIYEIYVDLLIAE